MTSLFIDSSQIDEVVIELRSGKAVFREQKRAKNIKGSQVILQTIDSLLKKAKLSLLSINKVNVHAGPGSFTGLRVGASIANALTFCLGTSQNDKQRGEFVYPRYE